MVPFPNDRVLSYYRMTAKVLRGKLFLIYSTVQLYIASHHDLCSMCKRDVENCWIECNAMGTVFLIVEAVYHRAFYRLLVSRTACIVNFINQFIIISPVHIVRRIARRCLHPSFCCRMHARKRISPSFCSNRSRPVQHKRYFFRSLCWSN